MPYRVETRTQASYKKDKCMRGVANMAQPDVKLPDIAQPALCANAP